MWPTPWTFMRACVSTYSFWLSSTKIRMHLEGSTSELAIRHSLRRSDRNHWVSRFSLPIRERSAKETVLGHSLAMTGVAGRTLQAILVYTRSVSVFITGCPEMDDTN
jgi:hypothetical protein